MSFVPRSIQQILDELLLEKNTYSNLLALQPNISTSQVLLNQLTSDSQVSVWQLLLYIMAYETAIFEQVMKAHEDEVNAIIASSYVGSASWYCSKALQFQYGDILTVDPVTFAVKYANTNIDKQIIGSAASEESNNQLIIKVRRKDTNILSDDEFSAFNTYIENVQFAGSRVITRNVPADNLVLYMTIYYNGQQDIATVKAGVEATINTYINNLPFNSVFYTNKLTDALQSLSYVVDPQVDFTKSKVGKHGSALSALTYQYFSYSGYLNVSSDFPLSTTINYIAV